MIVYALIIIYGHSLTIGAAFTSYDSCVKAATEVPIQRNFWYTTQVSCEIVKVRN